MAAPAAVPGILRRTNAACEHTSVALRRKSRGSDRRGILRRVSDSSARMVFLGFGKYARADKIYALEPIRGDDRGGGRRTLVWVDGIVEPIVASRTERTILHDMGQDVAAGSKLLDDALAFAERIAEDAEKGRVDLGDLGRRARKLLEASAIDLVVLDIMMPVLDGFAQESSKVEEVLPETAAADPPATSCFVSSDGNEILLLAPDRIELHDTGGASFPRLRPTWAQILDSYLDTFQIGTVNKIFLSYFNEIPLQELQAFRDYVNISIEMPEALKERFEFFRSEFRYKSDFGEMKVWLQPDWNDVTETYYIQLHLESEYETEVSHENLMPAIQQLHEGIKEVFHQILKQEYIAQLPQ
jgi:uncharacterized protein (TIGR04255 family)